MITTHDLSHANSSTPDAYDGLWLELLENPEAAAFRGEGVPSSDSVNIDLPGAGPVG